MIPDGIGCRTERPRHLNSPLSRSIAVMRLYGGFTSGKPCTDRVAPRRLPRRRSRAGAAALEPDPPVVRAPDKTVPWKQAMSERPGGGGMRPSVAIEVCDATNTVCVSGS